MTRPELPPGWRISEAYTDRKPLLLRLDQRGWVIEACGSRDSMVALAWSKWSEDNPEWAAYLEHIESETDR